MNKFSRRLVLGAAFLLGAWIGEDPLSRASGKSVDPGSIGEAAELCQNQVSCAAFFHGASATVLGSMQIMGRCVKVPAGGLAPVANWLSDDFRSLELDDETRRLPVMAFISNRLNGFFECGNDL